MPPQHDMGILPRTKATVKTCVAAPSNLQSCALATLNRCTDFTANLELLQLLPELDTGLQRALEGVRGAVESLARTFGDKKHTDVDVRSGAEEPRTSMPVLPQEVVKALLGLLPAVAAMQKCVMRVDAECRNRGSALLAAVQSISNGDAPAAGGLTQTALDLIAWRLDSAREMERALEWRSTLEGVLLPQAFEALSSLGDLVDSVILSALCAPCRDALREASCFCDLLSTVMGFKCEYVALCSLRESEIMNFSFFLTDCVPEVGIQRTCTRLSQAFEYSVQEL